MPNHENTVEVARILGMEKSQLTTYVDYHPDPSIEVLEAAAETTVTEKEATVIQEWLDNFSDTNDRPGDGGGGDPQGLIGLTGIEST